MKKVYETPEMQVLSFAVEEVAAGGQGDGEYGGFSGED